MSGLDMLAVAWLSLLSLVAVGQGVALWSVYRLSAGVTKRDTQYRKEHERLHWQSGRDVIAAIDAAGRAGELAAEAEKNNRAVIQAHFDALAADLRKLTIAVTARSVRHDDPHQAPRPLHGITPASQNGITP